jgi:polyhydroxybutyrate depolymerase
VERTYRLHLPAGVTNAANLPVVLNFHGLGSNGAEQETYSGLVPLSDREGFVLVSPDGTGGPRGWAFALSGNSPDDDLAFVDDLLATLAADLCIDTSRVYATGMSNGAFFSSLLACLRADRIAAIAPVAGIAWAEGLPCGGPVPVIAFHGVQDSVVPFYGGEIFGVIPYDGAPLAIAGWAGHNGCAGTAPVQEKLAENVELVRYEECAAATQLIAVTDGGHTWPGAFPLPRLGPTNREVSAAELIWAFFKDKASR